MDEVKETQKKETEIFPMVSCNRYTTGDIDREGLSLDRQPIVKLMPNHYAAWQGEMLRWPHIKWDKVKKKKIVCIMLIGS